MSAQFRIDGTVYEIELEQEGEGFVVRLGEETRRVDCVWLSDHEVSIILDGKSFTAIVHRDGAGTDRSVSIGGEHFTVELIDEDEIDRPGRESGLEALSSPMPGKVIRVKVGEGDRVKKGASLVIVEAMKMENEIRASQDSVVTRVNVKEGDVVEAGAPLVDLEPVQDS